MVIVSIHAEARYRLQKVGGNIFSTFTISTTLREKAALITGDPEFTSVEKIVKIE